MSNIIAYTWEKGTQCIRCTKQQPFADNNRQKDENGIPVIAHGRDGVRVWPLQIDDAYSESLYCDTCGDLILEVDTQPENGNA